MRGKTDPPRWTIVKATRDEVQALARDMDDQPRTPSAIFGEPVDAAVAITWHPKEN
jgi:hypothetical protein